MKAGVEFSSTISKEFPFNEELMVEVNTTNGLMPSNDYNMMVNSKNLYITIFHFQKCSLDSGVDMTNGTSSPLLGENLAQHSISDSNSLGNDEATMDNCQQQNGITKFAHNVAEFVNHVQEKLFVEVNLKICYFIL